jgi:hypothetical protein
MLELLLDPSSHHPFRFYFAIHAHIKTTWDYITF